VTENLVELARRRRGQSPPPRFVWRALNDPLSADPREWFDLRDGEVAPTVLERREPSTVVWTSIWTDHPELRIAFSIEPDGGGSAVTWVLLGPEGRLDADDVRRRRYRLNQLVNGQLRAALDEQ
jgi:hypothetical protein